MSVFKSFDEETFEKAPDKRQSGSDLPDGDYDVEIESAGADTNKAGEIFKFRFLVVHHDKFNGKKLDRTIFFEKKEGTDAEKKEYSAKKVQELKVDLKTLGFDVQNWTRAAGRPFEDQLALACAAMRGVHCKVRVKNGDFTNVYINKRLHESDGKPAQFGEAELKAEEGEDALGTKSKAAEEPVPF